MSDKIAVFGCKSTTLFLLKALNNTSNKVSHLVTIDAETGSKNQVADYYDLKDEAEKMGIIVYRAKQYSLKSDDDQTYINNLNIHIAFVMGWQRLIPAEILSAFTIGAFGMHGSSMNLPLGRGRSPMNWSILEGRKAFYTNLFKYDPGIDSGDIVDTFKFQVTDKDTGETMHYKNLLSMKYLVERNLDALMNGTFVLQSQLTTITPTYYPKRTPDDSQIDWEQDVVVIERFIRAVTRPFNGSFSFINDHKIIIWSAQIFDHEDFGYNNSSSGSVVAVFTGGKFLVKCMGGLLLVNEYSFDSEVIEGNMFNNGGAVLKQFPRNKHGFYDVE